VPIPARAGVSAGAASLLRGLLQREPALRLNFQELVEMPYLDMAHRPGPPTPLAAAPAPPLWTCALMVEGARMAGPHCLRKGTALAHYAVQSDQGGQCPEAASLLYQEAVAYLLVAARCA
jgi:hypothetical protein